MTVTNSAPAVMAVGADEEACSQDRFIREREILAAYEAGHPMTAIGARFGLTRQRVSQLALAAGLPPRRAGPASIPAPTHPRRPVHRSSVDVDASLTGDLERAALDLDEAGYQPASIARQLGVSSQAVRRTLRRYRGDPEDRMSAQRAAWGCDQLLRAHLAAGQHNLATPVAAALIVAKGVRPAGQGSAAA